MSVDAARRIKSRSELRAIRALERGRVSRNELDRLCGVANGPDLVMRLRDKGYIIHCERRPVKNRFGESVLAGFYTLISRPKT